jgi:hypothetical protein
LVLIASQSPHPDGLSRMEIHYQTGKSAHIPEFH